MTEDGILVTTTFRSPTILITYDGEGVSFAGPPNSPDAGQRYFSAVGAEVWTVEVDSYDVTRHSLPGGEVGLRVRRDVDWFPWAGPASGGSKANTYGLAASAAGLLWVQVGADDQNAPDEPRPRFETEEEAIRIMTRYRDNLIEVLGVDGSLVASRRYDNVAEPPNPITPDRWYRVDDDILRSIVILEPVLTTPLRPG